MQKHYIVLFYLLMALFSFRCNKEACLSNSGVERKISRNANSFHTIKLLDNVNLILTQDTIEKVIVEATENMQPNIVTNIENGMLTISNQSTCNLLRVPSEKVNVYVSVKNLDTLDYNGSGNISTTNTLIAEKIAFISHYGTGNFDIYLNAKETFTNIIYENADFVFHGKSDVCYSYTNARGTTDFSDFEVKKLTMWYASVRDAVVHATDELNATIYHTGNLYYKGNPVIGEKIYYSSGRLYPFH